MRLPSFLPRLAFLIGRRGLIGAGALLVMMVGGAILETASVAAIVPFLNLMVSPDGEADGWMLRIQVLFGSPERDVLLVRYAGALLGLFVVKNLYLIGLSYAIFTYVQRTHVGIARRLFESYVRSPWLFHLERNSAELTRNLMEETRHTIADVLIPTLMIVKEATVLVMIGTLLLVAEPVVSLGVFGLLGTLGALFLRVSRKKSRELGQMQQREAAVMVRWIHQGIGSVKEVQLRGKETFFVDRYHEAISRTLNAWRFNRTVREMPRHVMETLGIGAVLLVTILMVSASDDVSSILPVLGLFALGAMRTLPSANRVISNITAITHFQPALTVVWKDLLRDERRQEKTLARAIEGVEHTFEDRISIDGLRFRYPSADTFALDGVTLEIPRGMSVAFVGTSGAGKSTLVDTLLGLYEPHEGEVCVDGVNIRDNLPSWQRKIGYIPQVIYLLDDSVRRNVAFAEIDEDIDDARVWAALRTAQLDTFVEGLPEGLDTRVGEHGFRMSGGQRQRLGIARALYLDPPVMVLDEATAAVDNETEVEIAQAIDRLAGDKTLIIIAHRLSTIRNCDRIFLMEEGRVVAQGTYAELEALDGPFQRMVHAHTRAALGASEVASEIVDASKP